MAVPKSSKNQYISGTANGAGSQYKASGGNMLSSTSGSMANQATLQPLSAPPSPVDQRLGIAKAYQQSQEQQLSQIGNANVAASRNAMANQQFQLTPGGEQMGRFQQLQANRAGMNQQMQNMSFMERRKAMQFGQEQQAAKQQMASLYNSGTAARTYTQEQAANGIRQVDMGGQQVHLKPKNDGYALTARPKSEVETDQLRLRNDQRVAMNRARRGGVSDRDQMKIDRIKQSLASGKMSEKQGDLAMAKLQNRRGGAAANTIQALRDQMSGREQVSQVARSEAFSRPLKSRYSSAEVDTAKKQLATLSQSSPVVSQLGITNESSFEQDHRALIGNLEAMDKPALQDWALAYERKRAANAGKYGMGGDNAYSKMVSSSMEQLAKAIDADDEEEITRLASKLMDFEIRKTKVTDANHNDHQTMMLTLDEYKSLKSR